MEGPETIVGDERWLERVPDIDALARRCFDAARRREPRLAGAAAILLTDDAALRDLNARFRGENAPTNVLAFPAGEAAASFLGDLALAYETCAREAEEQAVDFADHAAHLIVHGLLHLVGHDHEADAAAAAMEALEAAILDALGVCNPYRGEET